MKTLTQLAESNGMEFHPLRGMDGYALFKDKKIVCRFENLPTVAELQAAIDKEPVGMSEDELALFWKYELESRKRRRSKVSGRYKQ